MTTLKPDLNGINHLVQLNQLRSLWEEKYPKRAEGGVLAINGFEHQFLLTLVKLVRRWKSATEAERNNADIANNILAEALSDITETGKAIQITQVKRTLSASGLSKALEELWEIFNLASQETPELVNDLQLIISGKFVGEDDKTPTDIIRGWGTRSQSKPRETLQAFKARLQYEVIVDPRSDLEAELHQLARDEDTATTIARWLGYFFQIGSGLTPESISQLVWKELINDHGLAAFRATLGRLVSCSRYNLNAVRHKLGEDIFLAREDLKSLKPCVIHNRIVFLLGPSGSGKSSLCKVAIQQVFNQNFDCFFLKATDVRVFSESSEVAANRDLRRLDELVVAQVTPKSLLFIIDDLSDAKEQDVDSVLKLISNTRNHPGVRFILIAHPEAKDRITEKFSSQLGQNLTETSVILPQLPLDELRTSQQLPSSITSLINRHQEFGPALNLKLLDWLIRSNQTESIKVSRWKNDLDLLGWFWRDYVQHGQIASDVGQVLTEITKDLADKFTPDLPLYSDKPIDPHVLQTLIGIDCLRISSDDRISVTHRFIGDCARFYFLCSNWRELENTTLIEWLKNPLWIQPIRWFFLKLALQTDENEDWQELAYESLDSKNPLLLDTLLDGVILSRQTAIVSQSCSIEHLPFVIERLIVRLLAIATKPYPWQTEESTSFQTRIAIQEKIVGIPKPELWQPVWEWLLQQNEETIIDKSCIIFKAAGAWLNWSHHAKQFPLRVEVAELILDLLELIILPDPPPQSRVLSDKELEELFEARQEGLPPPPEEPRRRSYYLSDFENDAFSCTVFSLRIIPERATWFCKVLAGRVIVPANKLEPTYVSPFRSRPGVGILEEPHPKGPLGKVNHTFRQFMLKQNGSWLNVVVLADFQLGVELFLALTIESPRYCYSNQIDDSWDDTDLGTAGSGDIKFCTFNFQPLITLLAASEEIAITLINTICQVAISRDYEYFEKQKESKTESDNSNVSHLSRIFESEIYEVILVVNNENKHFKGDRKSLYWHCNLLSPRILRCLLMTLEGWLYSRPTRKQLQKTISFIFNNTESVPILGVLVTLAKCYPVLLTRELLPLTSSLQLLIWLEKQLLDYSSDCWDDGTLRWRSLPEEERQILIQLHKLPYRKEQLDKVIHQLWTLSIPIKKKQKILESWDNYQIERIPDSSQHRGVILRALFDPQNWIKTTDSNNYLIYQFTGNFPKNSEIEERADRAIQSLSYQTIVFRCRQILDGKEEKTQEFHDELLSILKNDEELQKVREDLDIEDFKSFLFAILATVLESQNDPLGQELESILHNVALDLQNHPICLDIGQRCQIFNLDASSFIARIAPKLLLTLESDSVMRTAVFRCCIGVRDCDTFTLVQSLIQTNGLTSPITQDLIELLPRIARLIFLTRIFIHRKSIEKNTNSEGISIISQPGEIDEDEIYQENPEIEEAWLCLQNDFANNKLSCLSIDELSQWIPKSLITPFEVLDKWPPPHHGVDMEFLIAGLTPILQILRNDEANLDLIQKLQKRIIFLIVCERHSVYEERKKGRHHGGQYIRLSIHHLINNTIFCSSGSLMTSLDILIHTLERFQLADFILLESVPQTMQFSLEEKYPHVDHAKTINIISVRIGDFLSRFDSKNNSIKVLGNVNSAWCKLLESLAYTLNDMSISDRMLVDFLTQFQDTLIRHCSIRIKLYGIAKTGGYKFFRRKLFCKVAECQDILPKHNGDESSVLVEAIAQIWETDFTWIKSKQIRLNGFRDLLGYLSAIDAKRAKELSEEVASNLVS